MNDVVFDVKKVIVFVMLFGVFIWCTGVVLVLAVRSCLGVMLRCCVVVLVMLVVMKLGVMVFMVMLNGLSLMVSVWVKSCMFILVVE